MRVLFICVILSSWLGLWLIYTKRNHQRGTIRKTRKRRAKEKKYGCVDLFAYTRGDSNNSIDFYLKAKIIVFFSLYRVCHSPLRVVYISSIYRVVVVVLYIILFGSLRRHNFTDLYRSQSGVRSACSPFAGSSANKHFTRHCHCRSLLLDTHSVSSSMCLILRKCLSHTHSNVYISFSSFVLMECPPVICSLAGKTTWTAVYRHSCCFSFASAVTFTFPIWTQSENKSFKHTHTGDPFTSSPNQFIPSPQRSTQLCANMHENWFFWL